MKSGTLDGDCVAAIRVRLRISEENGVCTNPGSFFVALQRLLRRQSLFELTYMLTCAWIDAGVPPFRLDLPSSGNEQHHHREAFVRWCAESLLRTRHMVDRKQCTAEGREENRLEWMLPVVDLSSKEAMGVRAVVCCDVVRL